MLTNLRVTSVRNHIKSDSRRQSGNSFYAPDLRITRRAKLIRTSVSVLIRFDIISSYGLRVIKRGISSDIFNFHFMLRTENLVLTVPVLSYVRDGSCNVEKETYE